MLPDLVGIVLAPRRAAAKDPVPGRASLSGSKPDSKGGIRDVTCFSVLQIRIGNERNLLIVKPAAGGTRTPTGFATQRILSPRRLPFRHNGRSRVLQAPARNPSDPHLPVASGIGERVMREWRNTRGGAQAASGTVPRPGFLAPVSCESTHESEPAADRPGCNPVSPSSAGREVGGDGMIDCHADPAPSCGGSGGAGVERMMSQG